MASISPPVDVRFAAGDCLSRENDPGDSCYLIESGRVRLEFVSAHMDMELVPGYLEAGTALGEFSLIDKQPRDQPDPGNRGTRVWSGPPVHPVHRPSAWVVIMPLSGFRQMLTWLKQPES